MNNVDQDVNFAALSTSPASESIQVQKQDKRGGVPPDQLLELSPEQKTQAGRSGEAKAFRHNELEKLMKDEGGIFQYEFYDPGRKDTLTITRQNKLTPQDLEFITKNYADINQRPGEAPLTHKFTMVDDPMAVFKYVTENNLIDNPNNLSMEELAAQYEKGPQAFRDIAMGKEPTKIGRLADAASYAGRMAMAAPEKISGKMLGDGPLVTVDPRTGVKTREMSALAVEGARLQSDSDSFLGKTFGDMVRSPTLPLSVATSMAVPLAPTSIWGRLGKEAAIGAFEGLGETAMSKQQALADPSASDYGLNALVGAGAGGAFQGAGEGIKKGVGFVKDKLAQRTGKSLKEQGLDLWQDATTRVPELFQKGWLDPSTPAAKRWLGGTIGEQYDMGLLGWYGDRLGIKPQELYPGLGISNRNSDISLDLRGLATRHPKLFKQWTNTYDKLLKGMDKHINYSNAPTLDEAGDMMVEAVGRSKDKFFTDRQNTYRNLLDSDVGLEIDAAMDEKSVAGLRSELDNVLKDLERRKNKASKMEPVMGDVATEVPSSTLVDPSGQPVMVPGTTKEVVGEQATEFDNPGVAPKVNAAINAQIARIKAFQTSLDSRLSGAWPAGTRNENGRTLASELNEIRAALQDEAVMGNPLDKNPIQDKVISQSRDKFRDYIMQATKTANPAAYQKLKKTNEEITEYLNHIAALKADLDPNSVKSPKDAAKAVLNNTKKLKALQQTLLGYGGNELKAFEAARDAWMKHKLIRESATTGDIQGKLLKPLRQEKKFITSMYGPVDFKEMENYAKGLLSIGDPQLIGLSGQLKDIKSSQGLPKNASEAVEQMTQFFNRNRMDISPEDMARAKAIDKAQRKGLQAELGDDYYQDLSPITAKLSDLNRLGGLKRGEIGKGRAGTDTSDDESRAASRRRKNVWEVISR